jgi:hypothetical protein
MEKSLQTRITIVLLDRNECIITELKDDTKDIPIAQQAYRHTLKANQLSLLMFLFLKAYGNKHRYFIQSTYFQDLDSVLSLAQDIHSIRLFCPVAEPFLLNNMVNKYEFHCTFTRPTLANSAPIP